MRQLIVLLEQTLRSKSVERSKHNFAFYSPFLTHRKRKLEIHLDLNSDTFGYWHCWVSNEAGKNLFTLFKKINATDVQYSQLVEILRSIKKPTRKTTNETHISISLPKEFQPMIIPKKSPEYKNALCYLKRRGLTENDFLKYNIGYCEEGKYAQYVIIPSYNENGMLNYFVARSYYESDFKHKNPSIDKNDVVGNEMLINWDEPITLVEGAFDAIAAKINAIPLFGKTISERLKQRVVENEVKDIYIGLDPDALKDAIRFAQHFLDNGIRVYLMNLGNKDPNEMGFEAFNTIKNNTELLTDTQIMKLRLQHGIRI